MLNNGVVGLFGAVGAPPVAVLAVAEDVWKHATCIIVYIKNGNKTCFDFTGLKFVCIEVTEVRGSFYTIWSSRHSDFSPFSGYLCIVPH